MNCRNCDQHFFCKKTLSIRCLVLLSRLTYEVCLNRKIHLFYEYEQEIDVSLSPTNLNRVNKEPEIGKKKEIQITSLNNYCCHVLFGNAIALRNLLPSTVELHLSES